MNTRRSTNDWFNIGNDTRSASSSSSTAAPSSSSPLFCSGLNNGPSVLNSSVPIRLAFLRKVYSILFVQLGLTTLISSSIMFMTPIQMFIGRNPWILLANFAANLINVFALMYKRNEYPVNFYLLGSFTFFNSVTLGTLISHYDLALVVQAFFLTTAISLGLTVYTLTSKTDFTYLGGTLSSLLWASVIGSFLHIMFGNSTTETVLALFGAFLFSAFIVYDTHVIMKYLSAEEYIVAVINLYLDIINLFIKILRVLDSLKRHNEERSRNGKKEKKSN